MRVQPRQQLLGIWEAVARSSWKGDKWVPGGRFGSNSISDAEQLLCLLLPATQIEAFNLDRPDQTADRMVQVLRKMGTATDIPRVIIDILTEYYDRYSQDGTPVFSGGGYFEVQGSAEDPPAEQAKLPIVDSYALSITLSLASLGFLRVFRRSVTRGETVTAIDRLERAASKRLSAAMVGLLRSFSVNVFPVDSPEGRTLCGTVNPDMQMPQRSVVAQLHRELRQTIASFREVLIGSGQTTDMEEPDRLFECGWSWSVVRQAPRIDTGAEEVGVQPDGIAHDKPFLYFTVIALNAVEDLFSERTRILGLLNEEQQRLARALQLRSDLTRAYWATVATFGSGRRWPLENIPWRTTDGEESDYYTLQVISLAVKGLAQVRGSDAELARIGRVLATLAERARITSRATVGDANLRLHFPGVQMLLNGSEDLGDGRDRPVLIWSVPEFAALLLQRAAGVANLINDADERTRLLDLGDQVWDHLESRRVQGPAPGAGLWDQPSRIFPELPPASPEPSWYYTERVVEALVAVARVLDQPPTRNDRMTEHAIDLIREAEQIYDRELLGGGAEGGPQLRDTLQLVEVTLRRAREILTERPGTAAALASEMLRRLDRLAAARPDAFTEV